MVGVYLQHILPIVDVDHEIAGLKGSLLSDLKAAVGPGVQRPLLRAGEGTGVLIESMNHRVCPMGIDEPVAHIDSQTEQEEGPGQREHGDYQKPAPQGGDQRTTSRA